MENTEEEFRLLKKTYTFDEECGNCGSQDELHIHHIVPLSVGGTNKRSNLCTLCKGCHEKVHGGMEIPNLRKVSEARYQGSTPFGYRRSKGKLTRAHGHKLVRSIIELRMVYKMSSGTIVQALNDLGIESPRGFKWSPQQIIHKTVGNEKYFQGENIIEPVMKGSIVEWDMVLKHNNLTKGEKRKEYNNKDLEFAKSILKGF